MILLAWIGGGIVAMFVVAKVVSVLIPQSRYAHPFSPFVAWFVLLQTCIMVTAVVAGMHMQHQHDSAMLPAAPSGDRAQDEAAENGGR